jgi:asparagine synthase (glutamine-hydrolysing)
MCGITGFFDLTGKSSESTLVKMTRTLAHRGPDGEGIFFRQENKFQVGLGHRRLAIIDLSDSGKQPRSDQDLTITFNGEIFNYKEIKKELTGKGVNFESETDTEVILKAYQVWGAECLHRFIGMFAFVIYDRNKEEFFCARDRAGIKPFFYYWKDGLFLFASELKAFHEHASFKRQLDPGGVSSFMQFGNVPGENCIFLDCNKLAPGNFLRLNSKEKELKITKYWNVYDAYNLPKLKISLEDAVSETEKILQSAFQYRMVSDVPLGVFLSGGYDSTCLTALLQKNNSTKLKTFTIAVSDMGLNEAPFAKKISEHLGTEHHEYLCSEKEALEIVPQLPYFYDEPFGDQSAIPTTLVSRIARNKVTVALSADAGDEVFAGYNRYDYLIKYGNKLNATPAAIRKIIYFLMRTIPANKIPFAGSSYNFSHRYEKLKSLVKDPSAKNIMLNLSKLFTAEELHDLLVKDAQIYDRTYLSEELKAVNFSPLSYMMAIDYQTYLPDDILQKVDRATMSVSLEGREPFLDHRVIEWAAQLPDDLKYHNGIKKYILRKIVHKHVPQNLMERPKMGFAIPLEKWLRTSLRPNIENYLHAETIKKQGIFNEKEVEKMTKSFLAGKTEYTQKIWYLLMFQMWHERWMS